MEEFFLRGFFAELRKLGKASRTVEEIAQGKPPEIKVPENREAPKKDNPRNAGAAAQAGGGEST